MVRVVRDRDVAVAHGVRALSSETASSTGTIASRFVETDTKSEEVLETLRRIEADVADLKA
jgi:hypothetical protein